MSPFTPFLRQLFQFVNICNISSKQPVCDEMETKALNGKKSKHSSFLIKEERERRKRHSRCCCVFCFINDVRVINDCCKEQQRSRYGDFIDLLRRENN